MHLCTSNSIIKGSWDMCYRRDINICCSSFFQHLFLLECVIWIYFLKYIYQCLFNELLSPFHFKQGLFLSYISISLFINSLLFSSFSGSCVCVLRRLRLLFFSTWQKVKSCGNGKMAVLAVFSHGPAHRCFEILVTVLSTSDNGKLRQH